MGVGNLAHFMHKRPLFHYQQGAQTGAGGEGLSLPWPPHFKHCFYAPKRSVRQHLKSSKVSGFIPGLPFSRQGDPLSRCFERVWCLSVRPSDRLVTMFSCADYKLNAQIRSGSDASV